mgnify:CR=1 FL=1
MPVQIYAVILGNFSLLRKIIATLCITVIAAVSAKADGYRVSLVTCYPGQIVYELYGHTAIRIKNGNMDKAYNFGMFSFSKPNFIYRFVKGETDYALAGYPFIYFMPEYIERNSKVVEQVLNLSQRQAEELYRQLEWLSLPENREYRYNYVLDNCATRPRDMVEKVTGGIEYPQPADTTLTFRRMMRSYSTNYPWYQFGIDLALGPGIDYRLDTREQMFAPIYLMDAFQKAKFTDENGNKVPLVKEKIVLYEGSESPVLPPTPWYIASVCGFCNACHSPWLNHQGFKKQESKPLVRLSVVHARRAGRMPDFLLGVRFRPRSNFSQLPRILAKSVLPDSSCFDFHKKEVVVFLSFY